MSNWTFALMITNATDRELVVDYADLKWGYWNTDNEEDKVPVSIPPNKTLEALGLKAAFGPNGYECNCTWKDKVPEGEKSYGTVNLTLDVPFVGKNSAECDGTNLLNIDNWEEIRDEGHNFVRSIVVTKRDEM